MSRKKGTGAAMTIWLDQDTKAEIERLSVRIGLSPSTFARNLVVVGLEESRAMEKVGLLQAGIYVQHLREMLQKRIEKEDLCMKNELRKLSTA